MPRTWDIRYELWKWAEQKDWTGASPYWLWRLLNKAVVKEGYGPRDMAETIIRHNKAKEADEK